MALIDDVKKTLRLNGNAADVEVQDLINAAKADLSLVGITTVDEADTLIKRAITLYCKANYGYDNPEAARFQDSYEMLKAHLSISTEYTQAVT